MRHCLSRQRAQATQGARSNNTDQTKQLNVLSKPTLFSSLSLSLLRVFSPSALLVFCSAECGGGLHSARARALTVHAARWLPPDKWSRGEL